ncbi:MAG: LamG-like jellyroll fold domain-containing protein [Planctomycetota bacterium]|jgi:hypothetical protein
MLLKGSHRLAVLLLTALCLYAAEVEAVEDSSASFADTRTVGLWLFDEQTGLYPSCVLNDSGPKDYPMVLGPGGQVVEGKFGNALEPIEQPKIDYPPGTVRSGLAALPALQGRMAEPLNWMNAKFSAFMTLGENHLRKEVRFVNPAQTRLNLGHFDWTVEFWYMPTRHTDEEGVVFEIGRGPRGENEFVTRLVLNADRTGFGLQNQPSGTDLLIPSDAEVLNVTVWHHLAFVCSVEEQQIRHYVDGKRQSLPERCQLEALDSGSEAYFSVGRDGVWKRPLPGRIDELRFSLGKVYTKDFSPPRSFSPDEPPGPVVLHKGPPLLFSGNNTEDAVLDLGDRKHLFIEDAFVADMKNVTFRVNPPRLAECVIDDIKGPFRKHLSVIEDEDGLIRLYHGGPGDYLEVRTSRDGIHWKVPDLRRGRIRGRRNIVIAESTAMGNVFIDRNARPEARWKYVTGYENRGVYVYYSADGWSFKRVKTAALPLRPASQSNMFYDDQRQLYVGYHRSDCGRTLGSKTQRQFAMTETKDIMKPWLFDRVSQAQAWEVAKTRRLRDPQPWYLDNGPLTPGGLGIEFPIVFEPNDSIDPVGTDIYVPKAIKYPWAPDTYLAFPLFYFHYGGDGPVTRQILMDPKRRRGSGPIETQLAVSRDGIRWKRHPRPAYVGIGKQGEHDIHQAYLGHGLVKRGDEIWQYCFSETAYHSTWLSMEERVRAVYRLVQRLDGFVSADTPYDKEGALITRPFKFKGNRLALNIDTDAAGYAQVGFLDEHGEPIEGFSVDDCVYINGDFVEIEAEWIKNGNQLKIPQGGSIEDVLPEANKLQISQDVSLLEGRTVQLVFRMRGAKLYAMQFLAR